MSQTIPEGFNPHFRKSPLTDPWEPLYSRLLEDRIVLGLRADERHCNSRGIVHGGLITALIQALAILIAAVYVGRVYAYFRT